LFIAGHWTDPGRAPGRRDRIPPGWVRLNQGNLLSRLVKVSSVGACRARGQDTWLSGPGGRLTRQAKEMSRDHDDARHVAPTRRATAAGRQGGRGQHRVTGAGAAAGRARLPGSRAYPEISFRSELLAWVPAGWRAAGRLQVKNAEHELACHLDLHLDGTRPDGPRASSSRAAGSSTPGG